MTTSKHEFVIDIQEYINTIWSEPKHIRAMQSSISLHETWDDLRKLTLDLCTIYDIIVEMEADIENAAFSEKVNFLNSESERADIDREIWLGRNIAVKHLIETDLDKHKDVASAWQCVAKRMENLLEWLNLIDSKEKGIMYPEEKDRDKLPFDSSLLEAYSAYKKDDKEVFNGFINEIARGVAHELNVAHQMHQHGDIIEGERHLYTTEVCKLLGKSKRTIARWNKEGILTPAGFDGKTPYYTFRQLQEVDASLRL